MREVYMQYINMLNYNIQLLLPLNVSKTFPLGRFCMYGIYWKCTNIVFNPPP